METGVFGGVLPVWVRPGAKVPLSRVYTWSGSGPALPANDPGRHVSL